MTGRVKGTHTMKQKVGCKIKWVYGYNITEWVGSERMSCEHVTNPLSMLQGFYNLPSYYHYVMSILSCLCMFGQKFELI